MHRNVSCHLGLDLEGPTSLILGVSVATGQDVDEGLTISQAGRPLPLTVVGPDSSGTRINVVKAERGRVQIDYQANVQGRAEPAVVTDLDKITFLRPSRYAESDTLTPTARAQFGGLSGFVLLQAVRDWVNEQLSYVVGSSLPTDGAVRTLMNRQGVCRDYAHLTVALLRAMNVPARLVAVYAPGLAPMDFHAVAEAAIDDRWWVVDATGLAPREAMVRISTGRDAADTAFLSNYASDLEITDMQVTATVDSFPVENYGDLVQLG